MAVLPLGTGNDLARAFGWGPGFNDKNDLPAFLSKLNVGAEILLRRAVPFSSCPAQSTSFDRWALETKGESADDSKSLIMNNYFSLGLDAKVAVTFHTHRNENPELFTGQVTNLMWYAKFGSQQLFEEQPAIRDLCELKVDDKVVDIPHELVVLMLVNLPSCYGGRFLWLDDATAKVQISITVFVSQSTRRKKTCTQCELTMD